MRINLDRIPKDRPCAVHVPTRETAEAFYNAMSASYRGKTGSDGMAYFSQYNDAGGFCYYPRFHEKRTMTYGSRGTYDDWEVPVIEFESLIMEDLSIAMSDMPIESLFEAR